MVLISLSTALPYITITRLLTHITFSITFYACTSLFVSMMLLLIIAIIRIQIPQYYAAGISRGLTELHALGVVHSDIKQENVLLSAHQPYPRVRLADFGFAAFGVNSVFRSNSMNGSNGSNKLGYSSLTMTNVRKGTPIYLAPELLSNPYQPQFSSSNKVIAKSSRKTDMYAFALLTWEVLSQTQAFSDVQSDVELCVRVHSGSRPPLSLLPHTLPVPLKQMIQCCWDMQRANRKTACECLVLLQLYTVLLKRAELNAAVTNSDCSISSSYTAVIENNRNGIQLTNQNKSSTSLPLSE